MMVYNLAHSELWIRNGLWGNPWKEDGLKGRGLIRLPFLDLKNTLYILPVLHLDQFFLAFTFLLGERP